MRRHQALWRQSVPSRREIVNNVRDRSAKASRSLQYRQIYRHRPERAVPLHYSRVHRRRIFGKPGHSDWVLQRDSRSRVHQTGVDWARLPAQLGRDSQGHQRRQHFSHAERRGKTGRLRGGHQANRRGKKYLVCGNAVLDGA